MQAEPHQPADETSDEFAVLEAMGVRVITAHPGLREGWLYFPRVNVLLIDPDVTPAGRSWIAARAIPLAAAR